MPIGVANQSIQDQIASQLRKDGGRRIARKEFLNDLQDVLKRMVLLAKPLAFVVAGDA